MEEISHKRDFLNKELKVENWAGYFLQRLNYLYTNTKHCDLTLRFANSETIKVHRVVLFACTDYFDSIIKDDSVTMDSSITTDIVELIIGFMYTGKIDIRHDTIDKLYEVSSTLRLPILTRLIESHRSQDSATPRPLANVKPNTPPPAPPPPPPPADVLKPVVKNDVSTPKRLPIWKRKAATIAMNPISIASRVDGMVRVVLSKPIPTRFEWDDKFEDDFPMRMVGDSLLFMSHDNNLNLPQPINLEQDDYDYHAQPTTPGVKRRSDGSDINNMKEFGRQQQIRNELMMEEEDADDPAPCESVTQTAPKPILKQLPRCDLGDSPKRVRFSESRREQTDVTPTPVFPTIEQETASPGPSNKEMPANASVNKVDLTATSGEVVLTQPGAPAEALKRVRFSVMAASTTEASSSEVDPPTPVVENPAKIVSEVLKKYPYLVSGRKKNIKLKVMTNNAGLPIGKTFSATKNVSYIVLEGTDEVDDKLPYLGPWSCKSCNLNFATYPENRKHMIEVHHCKIDPRICEYCGLKQSKKHYLMFHQYTKHDVPPPPSIVFPKCDLCGHISISHATLDKHKDVYHRNLSCPKCHVSFKSHVLYTNHINSDWHRKQIGELVCDYPCPFCEEEFALAHELKSHIEADHQVNTALFVFTDHLEGGCRPAMPDRQYRCPYCEQIFGQRDSMQEHIVSQHWGSSEKVCVSNTRTCPIPENEDQVRDQDVILVQEDSSQPSVDSYSSQTGQEQSEVEVVGECRESEDSQMEVVSFNVNDVSVEGAVIAEDSYVAAVEEDGSSQTDEAYSGVEQESESQEGPSLVYEVSTDQSDHSDENLTCKMEVKSELNDQDEYKPEQDAFQTEEAPQTYVTQTDTSQDGLVYSRGDEPSVVGLVYQIEDNGGEHTSQQCLTFEPRSDLNESYESQGGVSEQNVTYEPHEVSEPTEVYVSSASNLPSDASYDEVMEVDESAPVREEMVSDAEEGATEEETVEVQRETEGHKEERRDHDYSPYNPVVMFQPNMGNVVLPQRVMLVTHPIAPLQVLLSGPNMVPEQLVSIPYPQCGTMQVVRGGQVVTTAGQVVTTNVPTECSQVTRERKVEPETLVNDWDESSQAEAAAPLVLPGSGPSRPEFF